MGARRRIISAVFTSFYQFDQMVKTFYKSLLYGKKKQVTYISLLSLFIRAFLDQGETKVYHSELIHFVSGSYTKIQDLFPIIKFFWKCRSSQRSSWNIFTPLFFRSSVNNCGTNFPHTFLIPKLLVAVLCTIIFRKFKCLNIIHTLNMRPEFKRFFAFTMISSCFVLTKF